MSETDAGCHMRPPTAHNEGHPPFCSGSPTVSTIPSHWASFPPPRAPATFLSRSSLGQRSAERVEKREKMMIKKKKEASGESGGGEQIHGTAWRPAWGHACHFSFHPFSLLAPAYARLLYLGMCGALLGCWGEEGGHCRPLHLFSSQAICSVSFGPACWTVEGHETWPSLLPSSMHAWRLFTLLLLRRLQT